MLLKFNFADILVHETNIVYETCQLKICSQLSVCNFLLFKNPKILQDCEKNIYIKYCVFQPLDFMKVFSIKMSILNSFNRVTFSVRPSPSPPCINITSQVILLSGQ